MNQGSSGHLPSQVGWVARSATHQAFGAMGSGLDGRNPSYVLVFSSVLHFPPVYESGEFRRPSIVMPLAIIAAMAAAS